MIKHGTTTSDSGLDLISGKNRNKLLKCKMMQMICLKLFTHLFSNVILFEKVKT